MSDLNETRKVT